MDRPSKFFTVEYIDKNTDERCLEEPRIKVTADGEHKSLWVGTNTILATVGYDESDALLWKKGREKAVKIMGKDGIAEWDDDK